MIPIPYLPEKMPATHHLLFLPVSGRKYIKMQKHLFSSWENYQFDT
jgi:hypothetical protein